MNIAVIGAGFTGLTAALRLAQANHSVTLFESNPFAGGLAAGFKRSGWDWSLEHHYHHLFSNDRAILKLASEIGQRIIFASPKTSIFFNGSISRFDSPLSLLAFPHLDWLSKFRTAALLSFLKLNPCWRPLELVTAKRMILFASGRPSWSVLWEPLFVGKFGSYASQISAAWFWARVYKRTPSLGYPEGGFAALVAKLCSALRRFGVSLRLGSPVAEISPSPSGFSLVSNRRTFSFDRIICTLPPHHLRALCPAYAPPASSSDYLGAVNLILSLDRPFLPDAVYWLNVNDRSLPFLALVEHTNFMPASKYGGQRLLYVGNYLPPRHRYFSLSAASLLKVFTPGLRRINPAFSPRWVSSAQVFSAACAQPVVNCRYSRFLPPLATNLPGLYLACMSQVYPWDRGTNYAVELGDTVSRLCAAG